MPRGLDHIIHAVRDLDAVAALYRRLGFTVGARNRHPWGTHNHIVQLPGFFIELLTVAEPEKLDDAGFAVLFGRRNQDFLRRQEGLSLLVLESEDADADAAAFAAAGIGASDVLRFERAGTRPDGSAIKVGFSLVFAEDSRAPEIGFATCRQHHPQHFWDPAFQAHDNGVSAVAGVVMVADNPSDHHVFLSAFTGERDLHSTSLGIRIATPRGAIDVLDPTAYVDQFGETPPDVSQGARLAAIRLQVRNLLRTEAMLDAASVPLRQRQGRLIVGPGTACGATLVFEAASGAEPAGS